MSLNSILKLIVLCYISIACKSSDNFVCPSSVVDKTVLHSELPSGWLHSSLHGERYLKNVAVYSGKPEMLSSLVPDSEKEEGAIMYSTWNLLYPESEGYWLGCIYSGTPSILYKKISEKFNKCIAEYKKDKFSTMFIGFSCQ